ncbi:hypothetical protein F7725_017414 [Dissostichus mawsoni]|uniref:Uncharacterized protein n=1 Tax=Dissostichus mawsoni TaxID=36200 RepID=A0A7J5Z6B9_DISMA|nr:hypothetical protein F7725_017414 [Dissostichus mawsoni]
MKNDKQVVSPMRSTLSWAGCLSLWAQSSSLHPVAAADETLLGKRQHKPSRLQQQPDGVKSSEPKGTDSRPKTECSSSNC